MKVYKIKANTWGYDEYDEVIVVAENEEKAFMLVEKEKYFGSSQCPLKVVEVNLNEERIILASFNAG